MTRAPQIFVVGSAPDADVVIDQPTVSKRHCEFLWNGSGWTVRDLGSTNGTFVNGKQIESSVEVGDETKITLGRGIEFSMALLPSPTSLKAPASRVPDPSPLRPPRPEHAHLPFPRSSSSTGWITLVVSLALATVILARSWKSISLDPVEKETANLTKSSNDRSARQERVDASDKSTVEKLESDASGKGLPQSSTLSRPNESPFWSVVLRASDGTERLVGSAVSVSSAHLVTLASIIDAAQKVKSLYPSIVLYTTQESGTSVHALNIKLHPKYIEAQSMMKQFEEDLQSRLAKVSEDEDPSIEESLQWSNRLEGIKSQMLLYDLAVIELSIKPEGVFPANLSRLDPNQEMILRGFPMIIPSPIIREDRRTFFLEVGARVNSDDTTRNKPLLVETDLVPGLSVVSMACTSRDGQVLGLCAQMDTDRGIGSKQRCFVIPIEEFWKSTGK